MALDTTIGGTASDSYVTLAEYEAYVVASIDSLFTAAAAQEVYLRRAAQWLDRNYTFAGYQQYEDQTRSWPRNTDILVEGWTVNIDTVPQDIKDAQMELAYISQNDSLDLFDTVENGGIRRKKDKVDVIEQEIEYAGSTNGMPRLVVVDGLLKPYIVGNAPWSGSGMARLSRG